MTQRMRDVTKRLTEIAYYYQSSNETYDIPWVVSILYDQVLEMLAVESDSDDVQEAQTVLGTLKEVLFEMFERRRNVYYNKGERPRKILYDFLTILTREHREGFKKFCHDIYQERRKPKKETYVKQLNKLFDLDCFEKDEHLKTLSKLIQKEEYEYDAILLAYSRLYKEITKYRRIVGVSSGIPQNFVLHLDPDTSIKFIPHTVSTDKIRQVHQVTPELAMLYPMKTDGHNHSSMDVEPISKQYEPLSDIIDAILKILPDVCPDPAVDTWPNEQVEFTILNNREFFFNLIGVVHIITFLHETLSESTGTKNLTNNDAVNLFLHSIINTFYNRNEDSYSMEVDVEDIPGRGFKEMDESRNTVDDYDQLLLNYVEALRDVTSRSSEPFTFIGLEYVLEFCESHLNFLKKKEKEIDDLTLKVKIVLIEKNRLAYSYDALWKQIDIIRNIDIQFKSLYDSNPIFNKQIVKLSIIEKQRGKQANVTENEEDLTYLNQSDLIRIHFSRFVKGAMYFVQATDDMIAVAPELSTNRVRPVFVYGTEKYKKRYDWSEED